MEEVKSYLSNSRETLTNEQLEEVLRVYLDKRIADYESVMERTKTVFAGDQTVKYYNNKCYYFRQCLVCNSIVPQDHGKFCKHIESHFKKMPRELLVVCISSFFSND